MNTALQWFDLIDNEAIYLCVLFCVFQMLCFRSGGDSLRHT